MTRRIPALLFAWVLVPGALVLPGCGAKDVPVAEKKPIEVVANLAVTREVIDYEDFTGRIEAEKRVDLRSRVTGYLRKVNFTEGDPVKENDVLYEIDPQTYEAEVHKADANIVLSQARMKRLDADLQRASSLRARNAISQEDFDKVSGDQSEAKASLSVSEANRELAKVNLAYTKIRAPITGLASRNMIDPGNLVKADDTILTTLVSLDPVFAYFDVDERTLLKVRRLVREGKIKSARDSEVPVFLSLADETDFSHAGTINFVDNHIDPATGTLRLRGVFNNPKRMMSPGLFVRVRLPIGAPRQSVVIAEAALGLDQGQKFVYVVNDKDEVVYRKVKLGPLIKSYRVIEEGVKEGERVIASGLQRIRPKDKVTAKVEPIPTDAGVSPLPLLFRTQMSHGGAAARVEKLSQ
jgi:RND family efflux transporter MFP subunit